MNTKFLVPNCGKQKTLRCMACVIALACTHLPLIAEINPATSTDYTHLSDLKTLIVTGTVKDNTGETVPGASIVVKGTTTGTVSDLNGHFSIDVPSGNAILQVSFVGYKTIEVPVNNRTKIEIVLGSAIKELDEVVVTALGIKREKKALGYAMQEVKTESLKENRSESVANMLQGKVAGVQISQSATGMGGSTRVIMRGLGSLSGNNQPLWVIDGVPINDGQQQQATQWGSIDYAGSASEVNPEDIESISVLKGANAAALYGSRAQNGAIVIVTKKGKLNQPLQIEYNGNVNFSHVYDGYEFQDIYGQGSNGVYSSNAQSSWGPKMDGNTIVKHWRNEKYGDTRYTDYALLPQKDRIKEFYQTGANYSNNIALTAGGKAISGRFAYTDSRNEGVTPSHKLTRQYMDVNLNMTNNWLNVGVKGSYIRQKGHNRPMQGEYGLMNQFIRMPRSIRLADLQDPIGQDGKIVNWSGPSNELINPYAYFYKGNGNDDRRNRIIGQVNAAITFTPWLKLMGKVGIDWINTDMTSSMPYFYSSSLGSEYRINTDTYQETNSDIMINFDKSFGKFSVLANLGTGMQNVSYKALSGTAGSLVIPHFLALSNGDNQKVSEGRSEKEVHSVFGNVQLGYNAMLYVDVTGRNDWSSTLPKSNWSYFYPSVSVSGIISEIFDLPQEISFFKVRGSWAKVGNDTSPYSLLPTYSTSQILGLVLGASASNSFPLINLKPESTQSYEAGFDLRMWNGRIGVDFTYYNSNTTNQILSIDMSQASGYFSRRINAGKMASHGVELMMNFIPIQTNDWQWDINLNWGRNRSKCVELDPTLKRFDLGGVRIGSVIVREGEQFGDIVGKAYARDEAGNVQIDNHGLPIIESDKIVGNMLPKWTGSASTSLRWKGLNLNMLIDIRHGGDIISVTDSYASQLGNSERSLQGRDGMVVKGVNYETGLPNTTQITAQQFYESVGGPSGVAEEFIYDGSYVKMREISLGYTLPKRLLDKTPLENVKISIAGRDLFFIKKKSPGINPEGSFSRSDYAQAFEISSLPPTRNFGFNLNVQF